MADKENARPWAATSIKSKGSTPNSETMTRKATQLISSDHKRGVTERSGRGVRVLAERGLNNNASTRVSTSSGRAFTLPSKSVAGPKDVTGVDPPASTSRFEGPLRVRVENSRPRDVSLSFWSPPTFTDGGGGEPTKTSLSSISAAIAAVRPTVTAVPSGLPEANPGSALMRSRYEKVSGPDPDPKPISDRRHNIASRLTPAHNRSFAGGSTAAPGKQLSTEKKHITAATTSTGAQSSTDCGGALATGDAAESSDGRGIRAPPFGSDISHILNWKPAHRPSGTLSDEASTNAAPSVNKNSVPPCRVVPTKVETPVPLPKATAPSLNALRVPVASSKRMFDEGGDVDYDSEEEGKSKEDNISLGEGRGKDGEDNSDKKLIGDPDEASKRRKRPRPSVESSFRGSSNVGANHGSKTIEGTVLPSSPEMPVSRGNPAVRSSGGSVSRSGVSKEHDKDKMSSLPDSVVGDGSRVPRGVPRAPEKETGVQGQEKHLETAVGRGEGGVNRNPGVMGGDDSDDEGYTSASLTAAAGGFKPRRSSGGGAHGRDFSPRNKSSFPQTNASFSGTRVSEVPAVASGAGFGAANGGVSSSNGGLHENPRKVTSAHVPRTLGSEVVVNGKSYWKTAKIGRGGSSEVFRVVSSEGEMFALKIVRVEKREEQSRSLLDSYSNEIELLKRLKGNRFIINLENAEVDREAGVIYIVLELGETDLDRLLQQHKAQAASTSTKALGMMGGGENDLFPGGIEENFVRVIWQQMLKAVNAMHEQRVVHGDLKPANFVLVRGSLKLIDFGIAKAISNDTTNISRDSRLGTMNYMCPEAFEDTGKGAFDPTTGRQTPVIKLGRASDIWSLGCILYQMTHGRTPFSHLDMLQKMRAITNRSHVIHIAKFKDTSLVETLRGCLQREPSVRLPISGAGGLLSHPYLHPVAARVLIEEKFSALVNEKVTAIERDLKRKHESLVAQEVEKRSAEVVARAVAAEQSRQAAGLSIAKSAVKKIIVETVRVLKAEEVLRDRGGLNCVTAMVMGSEMRTRGAAGNHSVAPPPSTRQQQ